MDHLHDLADAPQGAIGDVVGARVAVDEHLPQVPRVGGELAPPLTQWSQLLVDSLGDQRLQGGGAAGADLVGDVDRVASRAERGDQQQVGDLGAALWVEGDVRSLSVLARRGSAAVSSSSSRRAMALSRLLLILVPSVPSSTGAAVSRASGWGKIGAPEA